VPRITVVLPTHNRAHCLERAVRSVVAQDYADWELVLVDDGSTDATPALCERFAGLLGPRYRDVTTRQSGVSAARNRGIALAQGEFVALLDSDDFWLPQKLGMQVAALDAEPRAGFCFTDYARFDDDGDFDDWRHPIPPALEGDIYPAVLEIRHNVITSPSVLVRRDVLAETGGFDETMQVCEDIDLWTRIARRTACVPVRLPLVAVHARTDEAFAYRSSLAARMALYRKASREDAMLPPGFLATLYREMLTVYRDVALLRRDRQVATMLRRSLAAVARQDADAQDMQTEVEALIELLPE
jgi:glycosyltransferase involved in cell wall biosynthesis